MSAALLELLERVRACSGPDRELDADLCIAISYIENHAGAEHLRRSEDWLASEELDFELRGDSCCAACAALTASVDAALALVERCLPGAFVEMDTSNFASIRVGDWDLGDSWNAASLPLALLGALISSLIAQSAPTTGDEKGTGQ